MSEGANRKAERLEAIRAERKRVLEVRNAPVVTEEKLPSKPKATYSPELADEICRRISEGETLSSICKSEGMPSTTAVNSWVRSKEEFAAAYSLARELQADKLVDDICEIADNERLPPESRKIRVAARQWVAEKMRPGKYGSRTVLAGDAANPLVVKSVNAREVEARLLELMTRFGLTGQIVSGESERLGG